MKKIFGRILLVLPAIALQAFWYCVLFGLLDALLNQQIWNIINLLLTVLAAVFVMGLVTKRDEGSYKLIWAILIMAMPIFGAVLYMMLGNRNTGKKLEKKLAEAAKTLPEIKTQEHKALVEAVKNDDLRIGQLLAHVAETTGFPLVENHTAKYYPFGEQMFQDMCLDIQKAEKYIYLEYFIIQPGVFWDTLTELLAERVVAGVDVRVLYDDLGSIGTYSVVNVAGLAAKGIKCMPFNPFLFIRPQLNNRDHRKIMVIDGEVAYSGGVNLADEYINEIERFGKWKDIGFRITGEGVGSYLYMFAEFWNAFSKDKITAEPIRKTPAKTGDGYILSYYDSPMRREHTSNELFTELLSVATDYIWFYTPYLVLGDTLQDAFIRAAKRGVDVRIVMPGIPDKKLVFLLSRSYYRDLLEAGVKIYEYTPGFLHAKGFIADDKIAGIGTVNLDYRSLFLHYECTSLFYKAEIADKLKQDFVDTMAVCRQVTPETMKSGVFHRLVEQIMRLFAPLL